MAAPTDALTGLFQQFYFEQRLAEEIARNTRYKRPVAVALFELDFDHFLPEAHLRDVAGNTLMQQVGSQMKHMFPDAVAARYKGGRLAIILPEGTPENSFSLADGLRQVVAAVDFLGADVRQRVKIALTGGVACFPEHGAAAVELIGAALEALERAKGAGGNQVLLAAGPGPSPIRDRSAAPAPVSHAPAEAGSGADGPAAGSTVPRGPNAFALPADATDKLTGLAVRKYFDQRLPQEVTRALQHNRPLSVLVFEYDFGQGPGGVDLKRRLASALYKQLSAILRRVFRTVDVVARYEGHQFAAILPETGEDGAPLAAERLRKAVAEAVFQGDDATPEVRLTVSGGAAICPRHGATPKDLMTGALRGLAMARHQGGNQVILSPSEVPPSSS